MARDRRTTIGGYDAASILGCNPYKSAERMVMEKLGQIEPDESNEAMEWGLRLESAILDKYIEVKDAQ